MYSASFLYEVSAAVWLEVLSLISPHFEQWYDVSYSANLEKST